MVNNGTLYHWLIFGLGKNALILKIVLASLSLLQHQAVLLEYAPCNYHNLLMLQFISVAITLTSNYIVNILWI